MKRREFVGGALAVGAALALGRLPALPAAPAPVAGTFLFKDGVLEIGVIRDSLWPEQANHYQFLAETFANTKHVCYVTTE